MFFVLVPFLKRAPRIIIHLARNVEKGGGVLMRITLPNLKHSFICPVPVLDSGFRIPDSGFPCFPYAHPWGWGFFRLCYHNERGEVISTCGCSLVLS